MKLQTNAKTMIEKTADLKTCKANKIVREEPKHNKLCRVSPKKRLMLEILAKKF